MAKRKPKVPLKQTKVPLTLREGPWEGSIIYLDATGDRNTLWFQLGEFIGRYTGGRWEALA